MITVVGTHMVTAHFTDLTCNIHEEMIKYEASLQVKLTDKKKTKHMQLPDN